MRPDFSIASRILSIQRSLLKLTTAQLEQVRDLVDYLAARSTAPRPNEPPDEPQLPPPPPSQPTPDDDGPPTVDPEDGDSENGDPEGGNTMSLAWMLRLLFGDAELPPEAVALSDQPRLRKLDVPLFAQRRSEWCWAATTQMILAFHGEPKLASEASAAQLQVVRSADPKHRSGLSARLLNVPGWPPFRAWGFDDRILSNPQTLSAEAAQAEIDAGRPFAVSWHYTRSSGHMLAIVGYLWVGEVLWLIAHDPWPAGEDGGDRSLLSYDHYVRGLAGTWRTYTGIRPAEDVPLPHSPAVEQLPDAPEAEAPEAASTPTSRGWEAFLETLGDSAQRNQVIGRAISMVRALARPPSTNEAPTQTPPTLGQDLGIFSSNPGDPESIHFFHALPVLEMPPSLDLSSEEAMMNVFSSFQRVVIMIGGEQGHLTSITLRQAQPGSPWKVIRIGRSHLVKAFERLNGLLVEGLELTVRGHKIVASRHLTHLPLVMLRMPDARQYLLLMEVVGAPRRHVPFLFFPVYDDPSTGWRAGQVLTIEDLPV